MDRNLTTHCLESLDMPVRQTFAPITLTNFSSDLNNVPFLVIAPFIKATSALIFPLVVYISRDVIFDEHIFPFSKLHPNAGALLRSQILLLPENLAPSSSSSSSQHQVQVLDHLTNAPPDSHVNGASFRPNSRLFMQEIPAAVFQGAGVEPDADPPAPAATTSASD